MKIILWFSLLFLSGITLSPERSIAQNISGIINIYEHVAEIDPCRNTITVASSAGFSVGDRALLIQMKGAVTDQTNTANYGSLLNFGGAGICEIVVITSLPDAKTIRFANKLVNQYDATNGFVQLVRIPKYQNAIVTATLRAKAWDAVAGTGGIIILEADTLSLQKDIDASGLGFFGGSASDNGSFPSFTDYATPQISGFAGLKGEGIAKTIIDQATGRGAPANGGGGGNSHNSGGGGGANLSSGGIGGDQSDAPTFSRLPIGGLGGHSLDASSFKGLFLGGGGHQNDGGGSDGGAGGGIVIIKANAINSVGGMIHANGISSLSSKADGSGGGGAGGTVVLDVKTIIGSCIVEVQGGKGGDADAVGADYGYGPGGGGSGGVVYATPNANLSIISDGGKSGRLIGCTDTLINNTNYGSADGEAGKKFSPYLLPESNLPYIYPSVITPNAKICAGDTVAIGATGGDSYLWSANVGINNPSDSSQRVSPPTSTTYHVSITRSGCVFDDSVIVIVHPKPNVVITPSAIKFTSPGEKIVLCVPSPYSQYLWSDGETNDSITITVPGTYSVRVIDTNGCSGVASIDIGIDLPLPSVTVEVPDIQAAPGDHIIIPLNIISSNDLEKSGATEFRYTLRFNRSILAPLESILSSVSLGRERSITKTGTRAGSLTSGTLTQIEFIAALGDTTETTIYLDSFIWTNGKPINTTMNNGIFHLQGICPKGGDRLFSSSGYFTMSAVHPNPSNGITSVKYELLEPGRTILTIIDMMGRQVMTAVDAEQTPGMYHSTFDVSSLPNGIYKCVLQSATQMESHLIGVCR